MALSGNVPRTARNSWRYFTSRQIKAARAWAGEGGIAVHENIFRLRGQRTCHLMAPDEPTLIEAARSLGCKDHWIHRSRTPHFDLVGQYLERALERCRRTDKRTAHE